MDYDYMIYPKQFLSAKIPVEKNYCFFLMPFQEKFDDLYSAVRESLMKSNFRCNRSDDLSGSKPVINKILVEILRAQYVIVDLTDCNPNVFYELGIAHTFKETENVLLVKQEDAEVPFDIRHLQYQEYRKDNPKYLVTLIKKHIEKHQYISDFYEALSNRGIKNILRDNCDSFVEYIQTRLDANLISLATSILEERNQPHTESEIEGFLDSYQKMLHQVISHQRVDLLPGVLRLYQEILISCDSYSFTANYISYFLSDSFFAGDDLTNVQILGYQTDMAVALAERGKQFSVVLPWIIQYLTRSKAASIDLNRYKLESFLMTQNFEEVDTAMINSIFSRDCHVREHIADIVGEKHLTKANMALCKQLAVEENFYTAVSIIEAIGKIEYEDGLEDIEKWLEANKQKIISEKAFSVFRHAKIAIIRLDSTPDKTHRTSFEQNYGTYLTDDVPL